MIEVNTIIPLSEDYGIHGGYIKVVGTSFENKATDLPRHVTIRGFFERHTSKSTYSSDLGSLSRDIDIRMISEIESIQKGINRCVKVKKESKNPYDPNAIAVYINSGPNFIKIGYIPRGLAELIVTNKFKYYVVGFEKSGKGIMLTMIFNSPDISVVKISDDYKIYDKKELFKSMSLSKIRKRLCM